MKILSLGWGVQSFTIAAMVALGELEPIDAAIHADTTHESKLTYEFAARWTGWLEEHGINVIKVRDKNLQINTDKKGVIFIPSYTACLYHPKIAIYDDDEVIGYIEGKLTESHGQLRRQCTNRWKIAPMRRWIQANRNGDPVEQWIGISLDEAERMRSSDVKYITNRWPLIEKRMTRNDCKNWLEKHGIEVPPRSACTFCPYHSMVEWRRIKDTPEDWQEAVSVDQAIRKARPPYDLFVHSQRIPLEEVDLRTPQEKGQMDLWQDECSGICGV